MARLNTVESTLTLFSEDGIVVMVTLSCTWLSIPGLVTMSLHALTPGMNRDFYALNRKYLAAAGAKFMVAGTEVSCHVMTMLTMLIMLAMPIASPGKNGKCRSC